MLSKLASPAYAACDPGNENGAINLGDCLQLQDGRSIAEIYNNPASLVNLLAQNIFVLATIILFFMIIYAGFRFLAGGKKGIEDAKSVMTSAIIGFIIMFTAYWIVQLVKIITGIDIPI